MAIDTPNKRNSAISAARVWVLGGPLPDAVIDQADRQQIAWCYAGILAAPPGDLPLTGACAVLSIAVKPIAVLTMAAKPIAVLIAEGC
jgi:hypothetical protein